MKKIIDSYLKVKLDELLARKDVLEIFGKMDGADDGMKFEGLVISTEHIDRSGDIVMQDGIDTELYMKNPVILNSHNYYGIENIVGRTTKIYKGVVEGVAATMTDGEFAPTEAGKMAKALWESKCLSAASVGFIPEEFDKDNYHVITKSQLLEYSLVPVPANGWATRQEAYKMLTEKGITPQALVMKGFEMKAEEEKKEAAAGDECAMDDGTEGIFSPDKNGTLICIPKAVEEKSAPETGGGGRDQDPSEDSMWADLKSEHSMHEDAVKTHVQELCEAMKSEDAKKPAEDAPEDDQKSFMDSREKAMKDHMKKFKTVMKAEHERHIKCVQECVDSFTKSKPEEEPEADEKMIAAIEKILTPKIDELKKLFAAVSSHEGNGASKDGPETKVNPEGDLVLDAKTIEDLSRLLNDATREALTRIKYGRSGKRAR